MKRTLLVLLAFISLQTYAQYDASYFVTGSFDNGDQVAGTIFTNDEPLEVRGQLTDEKGGTHEFWGRWNGRGQVTGQTNEGVVIDLRAYDITT